MEQFVSVDNVNMLYEVLKTVPDYRTSDVDYILLNKKVYEFVHRNKSVNFDVRNMNKKFIEKIMSDKDCVLKQTHKIYQHTNITREDFQKNREGEFNNKLQNLQNEYDSTHKTSRPTTPNFADDLHELDKPINLESEIEKAIKERQYEIKPQITGEINSIIETNQETNDTVNDNTNHLDITNVDSIVESVLHKFVERSQFGKKKYGVDLDRQDLKVNDWITHAQEELMDGILYLEKLKKETNN
jgi:hypothetical protein